MAADPVRTRALLEHLVAAFEAYVSEHQTEYMDAFMGVHNFHKAIVLDLAERSGFTGEARTLFLQMAEDTFAQAMAAARRPAGGRGRNL